MSSTAACKRRQDLALVATLFAVYSLGGAVIEHINTNLHYPLLTALDPVKYPKRVKIQHNPILTGFPFWGIAGLVIWQVDAFFKRTFFNDKQSPVAKLIFDFVVWTTILTLGEYIYGRKDAGRKGYGKDGLLKSYDYSYMKYNYKGVIALPISIALGLGAVLFIRVNPYVIQFLRKGINASVCPQ